MGALKSHTVKIRIDSNGQSIDNVLVDRLWRSVEYICLYLNGFESFEDAGQPIRDWMDY